MTDIVTKAARSRIMSLVKGKNTRPEHVVRRLCTRLGKRYRLHRRDLPGTPDLVFGSRRLVIFVNGCFWHRHQGCKLATHPKTRIRFWADKFKRNQERDRAVTSALRDAGWKVEVIWECESRNASSLSRRIERLFQ